MNLTHRFLDELPELCTPWTPHPAPSPDLVVLNEALAVELGFDPEELRSPGGVATLGGLEVPVGSSPVALAYAGHQFGNYSPSLGDGRALLLGELTGADGRMVDVHLKGSGRTPYARGGDGKATLGPMLREYLVSEALQALGVRTTRSLAVVATGEQVPRGEPEPGAVLTRVAASHIRVGTFEYAVRLGGSPLVRRLADFAIERHYPHLAGLEGRHRDLLAAVVDSQAALVANWMVLGFVHGVMNTDNMTVSGEGIDYGPCAFMDRYDPRTVFSSIDHAGRYAYGNQPPIANWNLARLAETLLDLISPDTQEAVEVATEVVNGFPERFNHHWRQLMTRKLGLSEVPLADEALLDDLPVAMTSDGLDWTSTFRHLAESLRRHHDGDRDLVEGGFDGEAGIGSWTKRWLVELQREGRDADLVAKEMDEVNPVYIPRNHLVDEALQLATEGELGRFFELLEVLRDPFTQQDHLKRFEEPAPSSFTEGFRTFCGT